jgi:heparanase
MAIVATALTLATNGCVPLFLSAQQAAIKLAPSSMSKVGEVDARFSSYNVEMVEVTGGRFWKPYKSAASAAAAKPAASDANRQVGVNPALFQYRQPINLANPRLRKLAEALGPAYVRVSGSWANSTFFQDNDQPAPAEPPKGFKGVLTRAEWKGVVDFAHATGGEIVTSFAISPGTRDAQGVWTPEQAKAFLDYTKSIGGTIAATEFMNEPTFPGPGGAPAGYDAAAYARDTKLFDAFLRKESPQTIFLGPGSSGEGIPLAAGAISLKLLPTDEILKAGATGYDAFSYHFYGAVSRRCMGNTSSDQALTAEWLDRTDKVEAFYADLRDKYVPGKPMWLTETAEAACGGDPIAGQYVDTIRYLNQLGTMAKKGVKVVMHNTLASSDYGLLDEDTLEPRPDYWAALLWKRTMGPVVLDAGAADNQAIRIYAHCSVDGKGAVSVLALNTDAHNEQTIEVPLAGTRVTLSAPELTGTRTLVNGAEATVGADGAVGTWKPEAVKAGRVRLAPATATFLKFADAHNPSCM